MAGCLGGGRCPVAGHGHALRLFRGFENPVWEEPCAGASRLFRKLGPSDTFFSLSLSHRGLCTLGFSEFKVLCVVFVCLDRLNVGRSHGVRSLLKITFS